MSFVSAQRLAPRHAMIENIFVKSIGGTPIYLKDVAEISVASQPPSGITARTGRISRWKVFV
jgi:Cu/Ag efflux pump CusA